MYRSKFGANTSFEALKVPSAPPCEQRAFGGPWMLVLNPNLEVHVLLCCICYSDGSNLPQYKVSVKIHQKFLGRIKWPLLSTIILR